MTGIEELMKSFSEITELQVFCEQQHATILELTKKIDALKAKNKQLEDLLQTKVPLIGEYKPIVQAGRIDEAYEENICRIELKKLHDVSLERALTMEEARKVEIYSKLLIAINQKPKNDIIDTEKIKTEDLLRLVSGTSDESKPN